MEVDIDPEVVSNPASADVGEGLQVEVDIDPEVVSNPVPANVGEGLQVKVDIDPEVVSNPAPANVGGLLGDDRWRGVFVGVEDDAELSHLPQSKSESMDSKADNIVNRSSAPEKFVPNCSPGRHAAMSMPEEVVLGAGLIVGDALHVAGVLLGKRKLFDRHVNPVERNIPLLSQMYDAQFEPEM